MADLVPRQTWPSNLGSVAVLWIVLSDLVCGCLQEPRHLEIVPPEGRAGPWGALGPPEMLQGPPRLFH